MPPRLELAGGIPTPQRGDGYPQALRSLRGESSEVALRAAGRELDLGPLETEVQALGATVEDPRLGEAVAEAERALGAARTWLRETAPRDPDAVEAGARRFGLTVGRSLELALLCRHAQWCLHQGRDPDAVQAALRLRAHGVDRLSPALDAPARELALGV